MINLKFQSGALTSMGICIFFSKIFKINFEESGNSGYFLAFVCFILGFIIWAYSSKKEYKNIERRSKK